MNHLSFESELRQAQFVKSVPDARQAPPDIGAEVAFAGRSNVGKSSALNALTASKSLARASKTPGRTQHLVFFALQGERRLVDLPGYGFARVPPPVQRRWRQAMETYLSRRQSLRGLMLVMDVRHPLTDYDRQLLEWCAHAELPVHVLLTKADKLGYGRAKSTLLGVRRTLTREFPGVEVQLFSAPKGTGLAEARAVLERWLRGGGATK